MVESQEIDAWGWLGCCDVAAFRASNGKCEERWDWRHCVYGKVQGVGSLYGGKKFMEWQER